MLSGDVATAAVDDKMEALVGRGKGDVVERVNAGVVDVVVCCSGGVPGCVRPSTCCVSSVAV